MKLHSSGLRWLTLLVALATAGSALASPCPAGTGMQRFLSECDPGVHCCDSPCDESCTEESHDETGCQDCACCGLRVPASMVGGGLVPPSPLHEDLSARAPASRLERPTAGVFRPPRLRS